MTFNVMKKDGFKLENSNMLVSDSNIEINEETARILERLDLSKDIKSAVNDFIDGNKVKLGSILNKLESVKSANAIMHGSLIVTTMILEIMSDKFFESTEGKNFQNFKVEKSKEKNSNEYDYEEEDDYDYDEEVQVVQVYERKDNLTEDFAFEVDKLRDLNNSLFTEMDISWLTEKLITSYKNNMGVERLLIGDKNAFLQTAINLQKISIFKNSLDDFNDIKEKFKAITPMILSNVNLQKQLFSGSTNFPDEYRHLVSKEYQDLFETRSFNFSQNVSSLLNSNNSKKRGNTIKDLNVQYDLITNSFKELYLVNTFLSLDSNLEMNMENRNKFINYDVQNIKNFINYMAKDVEHVDLYDKLFESNSQELFIFSNHKMKDLIKKSKEVGRGLDLSFINNCSKLMASSLSIPLYDFILNDEDLKGNISPKKLFMNAIKIIYESDVYERIERKEDSADTPFLFTEHIIDFFSGYMTSTEMDSSFEEVIEHSNKEEKSEEDLGFRPEKNFTKDMVLEFKAKLRENILQENFESIKKAPAIERKRKKI